MEFPQGLFLVLIAVLLVISVLLVLPFLDFFLLAVLLAYLLAPLQARLGARVGPRVAAGLLVLAATVAVIVPFVLVIRTTAAEAAAIVRGVREGDIGLSDVEAEIERQMGARVDLTEVIRSVFGEIGGGALDSVLGAFSVITHVIIGIGLTVFLLYYFLKDGDRFMRWLRGTVPLPSTVQDDLYGRIDDIMWGVLAGHVFIAIVQGVLAGIAFVVLGIPNATFWTVVMIVLALLPIIGSFLVWGPAAVYLFLIDRPLAAAFLFLYGAIVVGISDDYLRPIVVDRYVHLNPSVIIIGVLGGIYVIGFMGIFFGPIIIGALRAAIDVFAREYAAAPDR